MHFFVIVLIFFLSSLYVLILDYVAFSERSLQQAFTALLLTIFFLIYRYRFRNWQGINTLEGKFFFLFLGMLLIQLLVVSTGGMQSPFLILIYLAMVLISFLFSFSISFLFLLFCLIVIFVDLSFSQNFLTLITSNPSLALLQLLSLFVIIPIAYIVSRQYHMKEALAKILQSRMKTTEAILESLPELIIVTNETLRILSTNDATVKTLQKSQSELLDKPLFDVLLLKDSKGKLVTKKTFFPEGETQAKPKNTEGIFTLITTPLSDRFVTLQIKPTKQTKEANNQISFIISFSHATLPALLDKARARYEALLQNIKTSIPKQSEKFKTNILLLEKIEQDTYILQSLQATDIQAFSRIDIAKLCKQIVHFNQNFADSFHVETRFFLSNFGSKDIAPLTVANYPVKPEQLTGPFFTVTCDVKKIEMLLKKLFDIALLLASSVAGTNNNQQVVFAVKQNKKSVTVSIRGNCPPLTEDEIKDIFIPYAPKLEEKTNLHIGSGLEGFVVKKITDKLHIPLTAIYEKGNKQINFTVEIPKKL